MRVLLKRPMFWGGTLYEPGKDSGPGTEVPDDAVLPTDAIILGDRGDPVEDNDVDMREAVKVHNDKMAKLSPPARLSSAPDVPVATNFPSKPLSRPASLTGSAKAAGLETPAEEEARLEEEGVGLGHPPQGGPPLKTHPLRDGQNADPGAKRPGDQASATASKPEPSSPGPKSDAFQDKKGKKGSLEDL